jgi:F-type H+-transporting ATPase subunit epsilon
MATRNTLHVEVVTAERELYNGEADEVNAPGSEGQLGILPSHAALLTMLKAGPLTIKLSGAEEPLFVSGGFLEVFDNTVTVLADTAEHAEEIDQARAEEARRRAQDSLAQAQSNTERAELQGALERAMARLHVTEISRRRGGRRVQMPRSEQ